MSKVSDRIDKFEFILSIIVFCIPIILPFTNEILLDSISDYAYTKHNQIYVLLLTTGVILFIIDGIKYENDLNYLSALFLLCVIIFPDEDYRNIHNFFAISFFFINVFNLIYYSPRKEIRITILIGILVFFSFTLCSIYENVSLYMAESFSLMLISGRYLYNKYRLKMRNKI